MAARRVGSGVRAIRGCLCTNLTTIAAISDVYECKMGVHTHQHTVETRTLGGCLDENSFCYTLEVSFYSYMANTGTSSMALPYTEEGYLKLGRNLARTFLDYYRLTGFISTKPSSGLMPKVGRSSARDRDRMGRNDRASSEPVRFRQDGERYPLDRASMFENPCARKDFKRH